MSSLVLTTVILLRLAWNFTPSPCTQREHTFSNRRRPAQWGLLKMSRLSVNIRSWCHQPNNLRQIRSIKHKIIHIHIKSSVCLSSAKPPYYWYGLFAKAAAAVSSLFLFCEWMNRESWSSTVAFVAYVFLSVFLKLFLPLLTFWLNVLCFTSQMMLLTLVTSVFLLLPKQYVYEVHKMDAKTSGVIGYLWLRRVFLTSNIGHTNSTPVQFPHVQLLLFKVHRLQPFF